MRILNLRGKNTDEFFRDTLCPLSLCAKDSTQNHKEHKNPQRHLGELQTAYQTFSKSYEDYQFFLKTNYHNNKIKVIKKQIHTQNLILQKTKKQLELAHKQLEAAEQVFKIDSNLYEKKVLSNAEYQNAKNIYLQRLQSYQLWKKISV